MKDKTAHARAPYKDIHPFIHTARLEQPHGHHQAIKNMVSPKI